MKKAWKTISTVLVWVVVAVAVAMMIFTIVSVNIFNRNDRSLFGYKAFIVLSDSMAATDFDAGDLVLIKEVLPQELEEGDIIAYQSRNSSNFGETVNHKIRSRVTTDDGEPGFITYGTTPVWMTRPSLPTPLCWAAMSSPFPGWVLSSSF